LCFESDITLVVCFPREILRYLYVLITIFSTEKVSQSTLNTAIQTKSEPLVLNGRLPNAWH
jgi:hypothetical protein